MSEENNNGKSRTIPNSSTKTSRGSKSVHSEKDQSTEEGFKPNYPDNKEGEEE